MEDKFIQIYDGVFGEEFCQGMINIYKNAKELGFVYDRQQGGNKKLNIDDTATKIPSFPIDTVDSQYVMEFNAKFWQQCYVPYAQKYSILNDIGGHSIFGIKVQEMNPSQGYHIWHCEQGNLENSRRILGWIVYLNDIEQGGETEFLYQSQRVKPKLGRALIFPASFTHTHRGNPPLNDTKYIITGWIEF